MEHPPVTRCLPFRFAAMHGEAGSKQQICIAASMEKRITFIPVIIVKIQYSLHLI